MRIFLALAVVIVSFNASAQTCLDANKVKSLTSSFEIHRWNGKGYKLAGEIPLCDSHDILNQLATGLILIDQLQTIKPATGNVGSDALVLQEGPLNYFKNRIKAIVIEDVPRRGGCDGDGTLAYVMGTDPVMYVCAQTLGSQSLLEFATTMIHEARHVDGFDHAYCSHGSFYGQDRNANGACDESYEEQGSYGVEAGFYLFVAKNSPDAAMAQEARGSFIYAMTTRFNELPWDLKAGVLAQDKNSDGLTFYADKSLPFSLRVPTGSILTSRSEMPMFYNVDGSVKIYAYSPNLEDALGALAKDFKNNSTPAQRNELVDAAYSYNYGCVLYTREIRCGYGSNFKTISLNQITPQALLSTPRNGIEIVATDGKTYSLPQELEKVMTLTEAALLKTARNSTLTSFASADNKTFYGTDLNDRVYVRTVKADWQELSAAKNKSYKKVVPYFWSQKLEAL